MPVLATFRRALGETLATMQEEQELWFPLATIASVLVDVALFGGTVFLSQFFQIALGKSPTVAGLMSVPLTSPLPSPAS